jgi:DNA polymerase III subunit alpha
MNFIHLRTHTEFSIADGTLRVSDAVAAAAADGQGALAITDLANLFGAVKLYSTARKKGVKPIIGADVWLEPEGAEKADSRLLLLVQNQQGYANLCELLTRAWTQPGQQLHASVKWQWLAELNGGLIALSGAELGAIGQALVAQDAARAETLATRLSQIFPNRFYIELQRAGLPGSEAHVRAAVPLAAKLNLPIVATHPVQFLEADDFEAHEARVCVAEGEMLSNPKRVRRFCADQHFKTQAQMQALFADLPSALANTVQIAKRCNLHLILGKPQLPDFATPLVAGAPMPMADYFAHASHEGLKNRLQQRYPNEAERETQRPHYVERLDFEISTILKMGFPGYFLIVADFIHWAQNNGCPVGPGRGSGAGSLVAYALNITGLDPLQYNLLFERFLNPERVSMPDFDIDFCQGNRDRVIDYVKQKYGREAVSQIATFGTMAAKAALRDVGRVLGMGYGHVDSISKLIPAPPGKQVTLARVPEKPDPSLVYARQEAPELNQREAAEEEVAELLALAMRVEGITRNVGMHAGGVLIAPGKITDFCPLYMQPGSDNAVSQFDKDDVEAIGLVKFDFLGLATLTILELAKQFIQARRPEHAKFDYDRLPLDDKRVYKLFSEGKTESVFQFESPGMQRMLKDAKPTRIEDLFALNAMFRPGPMENIPTFCARKHGKEEVRYPHPLLETVLGETYGVMVYQEQVMQAAQVLGGYSLGGADLLRRAMGKKKAEEMAQHRQIFRDGAAKKDITTAAADEVFDLMEKFAGYGFNKSHAAAYSLLAYHTAWIKVHCTAEFFAANLTVEMGDTDKLRALAADAKIFAIELRAPDINSGVYRFEPISDTAVQYGLGAIKGTGQGAIEAIVTARTASGPYTSLFDFCARVDRQRVNKRVIDALIKSGAFDTLHPDRARLLASSSLAMDWADTQTAHANQGGLFDFDDEVAHGASTQEPALVEAEPWSIREKLTLEKAALGFYMSGHLFDQNVSEVSQFAKRRIADLLDSREPQLLAGIVTDLRVVNGQRGRVAIFKLDDKTEALESVINEDLLNAHRDLIKEDELLIVQGKVQPDRFSGGLRLNVTQVWDLPAARCRFGKHLRLSLRVDGAADSVPGGESNSTQAAATAAASITEVLREFPPQRVATDQGELTLGLNVHLQIHHDQARGTLDLGQDARFYPTDAALTRWQTLSNQGKAVVAYE